MKILLFVSSHCPHCPAAEQIVKKVVPDYYDHGLSLKKIRIKTKEGKKRSLEYNVRATPTTLVLDDKGNEIKRMVGVVSEDNLRASIEKLLGLRESFLSWIFGRKNKSKI
ncbi:Thioredoxin [ANME-1 cluster archaeon GoMg1]|nr:Thioredoxin [ANME-1 cluster archaeon GoMg1]